MSFITYDYIRSNPSVNAYISYADEMLHAIGFTEHSKAHVTRAAETAFYILSGLGYEERMCELSRIAAYLHDIGNVVNRSDHAQSGALIAFRILSDLGMPNEEIAIIISAIGHHDELTAAPVNPVAAALIIADKTDVRRSRVREGKSKIENLAQDIHDRVNYACIGRELKFAEDKKELLLRLTIDEEISSIMEYFEIFLTRMSLCRVAAESLNVKFRLKINNSNVL